MRKKPTRPEFKRRAAVLESIGTQFYQKDRWEGDPPNRECKKLPVFTSIKLPLTPEEWFSLCNSEDGSNYMGGCCGTASQVQDYLNGWFRFSWVACSEFAEVMEAWSKHDGGEEFKEKPDIKSIEKRAKKFLKNQHLDTSSNPWEKMLICWWAIQKHYDPKAPAFSSRSKKRSDLENAIRDIERMSLGLSFVTMLGDDQEHPDHQRSGNKAKLLVGLYPPIKRVLDLMENESKDLGFKGWAIFDSVTDDVCQNGFGLCIFDDETAAKEMLADWIKSDEEKEHRPQDYVTMRQRLRIRPLVMTIKDGIKFLD